VLSAEVRKLRKVAGNGQPQAMPGVAARVGRRERNLF
jgi:hypothetical protein